MPDQSPLLLCEPYLLDPRAGGVHVLWHTEHPGLRHVVLTGAAVAGMSEPEAVAAATGDAGAGPGWRRYEAVTTRLRRMREDADSDVPGRAYQKLTERPVHRHLARVTGLRPGRTPYRVVSVESAERVAVSPAYTLAPAAPSDRGVRLLLTSDHQLSPLTPANIEAVAEVAGCELDGVLAAGDLVNHADRASDWFDSGGGRAFFAVMAGRGRHTIAGRTYRGAPLLPHTPLFPAIGNHEVMGRWSTTASLDEQFHDAVPLSVADDGWDVTTYEQLFPYPRSDQGGSRWWARRIGDVHVTALFVTNVWRPADGRGRGRFQEAAEDLAHPDRWGHGQHIFEPVRYGSRQYAWLAATLDSPEARDARYRVVMFHHAGHGLGAHTSPPYTDPVRTVQRDPATGAVTGVAYHYPKGQDHILRDLEPLFSRAGVHLVLSGHSHLWNRFRNAAGVHWLETSNVGNSFGAYHPASGRVRPVPDHPDYAAQGDPGGLTPIVPTVAPLRDEAGRPLPYLASNDITAFSILDSAAGVVRSYRFDTREPQAGPVLFDEFALA
ncbi:MAG TPA: metallophosphoesterase [Natronosporangium sp.]|nr:metallophosphoesterase [Natronosporangium sp.]